MEIRFRDGWEIRGKLRIPILGPEISIHLGFRFGGAQAAEPQSAPLTEVSVPVDLTESEPYKPASIYVASATCEDYFGSRGFMDDEVQWLAECILPFRHDAEAFAEALERMRDVVRFVERAHKVAAGLKLRDRFGTYHESHNEAVKVLDWLLLAQRFDRTKTVEEIRDELKKQFPGAIFPKASSRTDLDHLLDCARFIGLTLAERGTFSCKCRPMPELMSELRVDQRYIDCDRRLGHLILEDDT